MLIGLIIFFGLSFLILIHEAGHFFAAKMFSLKVDEFGFGFPPRIFAWKKGETEYSLNWLPVGGFVRIAGENDRLEGVEHLAQLSEAEKKRFFFSQPAWKRSLIILAGVAMNFLIGWILVSAILMIGTPRQLVITDIQAGSPAEAVGLKPGDVISGFKISGDFIAFVDAHRGESVSFEIKRGNEKLSIQATPRRETKEGEGALGVLLGDAGADREPFFAAIGDGLREAAFIFWYTVLSFADLIKNLVSHATVPAEVSGPVGIFVVAQQTGKLGLIYLVQLLAVISLNLCVLNLMPFPALDGGRFFMILIEKIKGSPISQRTEIFVNTIGFALLMLLIAGITVRDIIRLF